MDFTKKLLGYFLCNDEAKAQFFHVFTGLRNKLKRLILAFYSNPTILNSYLQKLLHDFDIILIITFLINYFHTYIHSTMFCILHRILLNYKKHLLQPHNIRVYNRTTPSIPNILKVWFYKYFLKIRLLSL